ncbi:MAG: MBL fold metallo-hydrolase [Betaproteobacteria bacterium]|nr:MAG: MBL fold metallo-hydrolase [Betaproteobacteria bacterium]
MPAWPDCGARIARALLICACTLLTYNATAAESLSLKPIRLSEHIWYVQGQAGPASATNQGFISNAGFVVTPEGVVVIDALGTPALGRALLAAIRRVSDKPIRRVIVTHYHSDHFYGLPAFKATGADIWAHRNAREYLDGSIAQARLAQRQRELALWVNERTQLVRPNRWLEGSLSFVLGGLHFDLIYVGPAHAPDDLAVMVREDAVLFSGDIVFSGRIPFVGDADSRRWLAAMDELLQLNPKVLVPGHGAASRDAAADLVLTRDYLRYLRAAMGKAAEELLPFDEAYQQTDWSKYKHMPAFEASNRINAYGTYLLLERESLQR